MLEQPNKPSSSKPKKIPFQSARGREQLNRAMALAVKLHGRQTRKQVAVPYVSHLWAVASLVLEFGGNEEQAIAALLHDAAEDQGGTATLNRIRREFGDAIAQMVANCSDSLDDKGVAKPGWRQRKEAYLQHLAAVDAGTALVVAADKLHNVTCTMRDFAREGQAVWKRFNRGRAEQFWYYRGCVRSLQRALAGPLVAELDSQVEAFARLAKAGAGRLA